MKSLDLHGIKHSVVQKTLDSFLWENMKIGSKEVEVITGVSEQMKTIVKTISEEYEMKCFDDYFNPGKMIIILK